jgi:hypothetical protein
MALFGLVVGALFLVCFLRVNACSVACSFLVLLRDEVSSRMEKDDERRDLGKRKWSAYRSMCEKPYCWCENETLIPQSKEPVLFRSRVQCWHDFKSTQVLDVGNDLAPVI